MARLASATASNSAAIACGESKSSSIAARNRATISSSRGASSIPTAAACARRTSAVEPVEGLRSGLELARSEVHRTPVVALRHRQPERAGTEVVQRFRRRDEVAGRLRHLLAVDRHHAAVDPVLRERVAGASACARSFSWCGNRRSLPPPWRSKRSPSKSSDIAEHSMCQPGPSLAPRRVPGRLARLRRLPQREVHRAALLLVDVDPGTGRFAQLRDRAVRELAVAVEARDVEVDAVLVDHVGVARCHELFDELDHLLDVLGGVRAVRRRLHVETAMRSK